MRLAEPFHGASRWVQAMSAWSVKARRNLSRHCEDARLYGHTTKAGHAWIRSTPCTSPPPPSYWYRSRHENSRVDEKCLVYLRGATIVQLQKRFRRDIDVDCSYAMFIYNSRISTVLLLCLPSDDLA